MPYAQGSCWSSLHQAVLGQCRSRSLLNKEHKLLLAVLIAGSLEGKQVFARENHSSCKSTACSELRAMSGHLAASLAVGPSGARAPESSHHTCAHRGERAPRAASEQRSMTAASWLGTHSASISLYESAKKPGWQFPWQLLFLNTAVKQLHQTLCEHHEPSVSIIAGASWQEPRPWWGHCPGCYMGLCCSPPGWLCPNTVRRGVNNRLLCFLELQS